MEINWTIVGYVIAVLLNIGVVAVVRDKAFAAGKNFLASGRFAFAAVYVLCFLQMLVVGGFEQLQDPAAFTALLKAAAAMAATTMATHAAGKTIAGR